MQFFGLGYLVVQIAVRDGVPHLAPAYLGLVGLTRAVPGLGFGLLGGAFADRADRRRLMIASHLVAAAAATVLAVLTFAGPAPSRPRRSEPCAPRAGSRY